MRRIEHEQESGFHPLQPPYQEPEHERACHIAANMRLPGDPRSQHGRPDEGEHEVGDKEQRRGCQEGPRQQTPTLIKNRNRNNSDVRRDSLPRARAR